MRNWNKNFSFVLGCVPHNHEVEMYWFKVEPPFQPLHDDPRWQEMLDKVGFPD